MAREKHLCGVGDNQSLYIPLVALDEVLSTRHLVKARKLIDHTLSRRRMELILSVNDTEERAHELWVYIHTPRVLDVAAVNG